MCCCLGSPACATARQATLPLHIDHTLAIFHCFPCGRHLPSSVSLAAWWATQEAAKQCVAARLRTHHGGPSQTLAAFERALQAAVAQLQSNSLADGQAEAAAGGAPPAAGGESRRQVTALLLIFLHALEQGIAGAGRGCTSRAAAPQSAVSFFAANDKVRHTGWRTHGSGWRMHGSSRAPRLHCTATRCT